MVNALIWNRGDTEWIGLESPGIGVIESRNLQPGHPVMFGMPENFPITHYNGPLFDIDASVLADASAASGLSAVANSQENFTHAERFLRFGETCNPDDTILGRAASEGIANIVCGYNGRGRVVLFGSHPEFGYNLAMDRWDLPARMLANAAYWQASQLRESRPPQIKLEPGTPRAYPTGSGLGRVAAACSKVMDAVEQLDGLPTEDRQWLAADHAMSAFGLSGREIWRRALGDFADVTARMQLALEQAENLIERAEAHIKTSAYAEGSGTALLREALLAFEDALHYRTPAEWQQDFGYEGILQMLERAHAMLGRAYENRDMAFDATDNPYAYFETSPYQLVVGSYLAANGVYLNSWQLMKTHLLRIEDQLFALEAGMNIGRALIDTDEGESA